MQGKEVVVSAASVQQEQERRAKEEARRKEISASRADMKMKTGADWEREREREESEAEERLRAAAKESEEKSTATKAQEITKTFELNTEKKAEEMEKSQKAMQSLSTSTAPSRNHVLFVSAVDVAEIQELEKKGNSLTKQPNLETAGQYLQEQQDALRWVNLRVYIHHSAYSGTGADAIENFLNVVRKQLPIQPAVVVLAKSEGEKDTTKTKAGTLLHNPPYVVLTHSIDKANAFVEANKKDLTVEEELKVHKSLTATEKDEARDGQVLGQNRDQDLRLKSRPTQLTHFIVSMYWKGMQDLDLSCICLSRTGEKEAIVHWGSRFAHNCFVHAGDVKKAPNGAKERITVHTTGMPDDIVAIYFVVNSFKGKPFEDVEMLDAQLTVADNEAAEPFAQLPLTGTGGHTAVVLCRVYRTSPTSWAVMNINAPHPDARTARALLKTVQDHLAQNPLNQW
eukprot:TRINITY_DN63181_c0_g1_i1.p1 TRINITY_DN63181_c0_g1~~TRINITY_DN63181_c0_g1_i1.p1  ORF type:complete len:486 (-),score=55.41 TRINITY_DN63181_c0_g1_i1:1555-2916(-)